jgi:predicted Rossmann fold nucleotide-binding protein DprA/Smf involved in DNA uptake
MSSGIIHIKSTEMPEMAVLGRFLGDHAPESIAALGNLDILKEKKTAFFCSSKCPGDLIIKTYDLARKWRDDGITIIGGFHSPMEQECLTILLRGKQPVIVCPARSIETMRLKAEYKIPLGEGRLLILSPFAKKDRRVTSETSLARNYFVAALADEIFVTHAAPGSKTEQFCREVQEWGKEMRTFENEVNNNILSLGRR